MSNRERKQGESFEAYRKALKAEEYKPMDRVPVDDFGLPIYEGKPPVYEVINGMAVKVSKGVPFRKVKA